MNDEEQTRSLVWPCSSSSGFLLTAHAGAGSEIEIFGTYIYIYKINIVSFWFKLIGFPPSAVFCLPLLVGAHSTPINLYGQVPVDKISLHSCHSPVPHLQQSLCLLRLSQASSPLSDSQFQLLCLPDLL